MSAATMEAGRELDIVIARDVLGLPFCDKARDWPIESGPCSRYTEPDHYSVDGYNVDGGALPQFSTDVAAASRVLEKLAGAWNANVRVLPKRVVVTFDNGYDEHRGEAETMPLAICRAALDVAASARTTPAENEGRIADLMATLSASMAADPRQARAS
jgi:hypothetical protein